MRLRVLPTNMPAVEVSDLRHWYGERQALAGVSFRVEAGELFALLGPNGGGKSTLFRVLATLLPPSAGTARVAGHDVVREPAAVRRAIGVVFQRPSVDGKLTVEENLRHQGHLHGMHGRLLARRIDALLERFGLSGRRRELVECLSGGLQRRVELAKGLLPGPRILLLDEPSAGLDATARRDLGRHLRELRDDDGVTIVLTTHHIDEAEGAGRVAVLDRGRLVALATPAALKARVGGDVLVVRAADPAALRDAMERRFGVDAVVVDGTLRVEHPRAAALARDLVDAFPEEISWVGFGKPTLEDAFVHLTGHRFGVPAEEP